MVENAGLDGRTSGAALISLEAWQAAIRQATIATIGLSPQPAGINVKALDLALGKRGGCVVTFAETMHELSIMQSALELALDEAQKAGAARLRKIRLRIGALSGVVPNALQFAFEVLTPGTPAEGAELVIDNVPARFWCFPCAKEFESDDLLAECPVCHNPSGDLHAGREMEVGSIEID